MHATKDERFETSGDRGFVRPAGTISAGEVVYLINGALADAREQGLRRIVVNIRATHGFESPGPVFRRWAAQMWAATAAPYLRVAMVARREHICPEKTGVLAAAEAGLHAETFEHEPDAVAWLAGPPGRPRQWEGAAGRDRGTTGCF